jgi:hypothetical protein
MNPRLIDSLMSLERQLHNVSERLTALEQRIMALEQRMPATAPAGTAPIVVRMTGENAAADERALSDAMTRRDALEVLTGQRAALIVLEA